MKWVTFRRIVQFSWFFLFFAPVMGFTFILGTMLSSSIFGVALTDPLAGLGIITATKKIYLPLIISMLLVAIPYAAVGRAYCGYVCPVNTSLDFLDRLISVLGVRKFLSRSEKKFSRAAKYKILMLVLVLSLLTALPVYEIVNPNAILNRNTFFGIESGILVIAGLVGFDYSVSKRGWCRYFCPQGAAYSLIGKFSPLRVKVRSTQECEKCYMCEQSCPMGIPLSDFLSEGEAVSDKECTKCGECIDACKTKTLYMGWR